jgi:transcriptional regulator with XRE-family HTH domain
MRIERSKAWWLAKAEREGNSVVGAGALALDAKPSDVTSLATSADDGRIAFGRFISLMRRRRGLSVEKLAEVAKVEASELLVIEEDVQYVPEHRTVYQLAQAFDVPQKGLLQLSGLAVATDPGLRREAVRFAARSESIQKLTAEEAAALDAFVIVLSQSDSKTTK